MSAKKGLSYTIVTIISSSHNKNKNCRFFGNSSWLHRFYLLRDSQCRYLLLNRGGKKIVWSLRKHRSMCINVVNVCLWIQLYSFSLQSLAGLFCHTNTHFSRRVSSFVHEVFIVGKCSDVKVISCVILETIKSIYTVLETSLNPINQLLTIPMWLPDDHQSEVLTITQSTIPH